MHVLNIYALKPSVYMYEHACTETILLQKYIILILATRLKLPVNPFYIEVFCCFQWLQKRNICVKWVSRLIKYTTLKTN